MVQCYVLVYVSSNAILYFVSRTIVYIASIRIVCTVSRTYEYYLSLLCTSWNMYQGQTLDSPIQSLPDASLSSAVYASLQSLPIPGADMVDDFVVKEELGAEVAPALRQPRASELAAMESQLCLSLGGLGSGALPLV